MRKIKKSIDRIKYEGTTGHFTELLSYQIESYRIRGYRVLFLVSNSVQLDKCEALNLLRIIHST